MHLPVTGRAQAHDIETAIPPTGRQLDDVMAMIGTFLLTHPTPPHQPTTPALLLSFKLPTQPSRAVYLIGIRRKFDVRHFTKQGQPACA